MGGQFYIPELIQILRKTFGAIDIRCAAIREGEAWVNCLTVVRLTYETPAAAEEHLRDLELRHGPANTKRFRIVLGVRPLGEWTEFCAELSTGLLRVGDVTIRLNRNVSVAEELVQLTNSYGEIRPFDGLRWPCAELYVQPQSSNRLTDRALVRELATQGYTDPYEPINSLCEVNVALGRSPGYEFSLSLPVLAAIEDVRISPSERKLSLSVRRHREFLDLNAFAFLREGDFVSGTPSSTRVPIQIPEECRENQTIVKATASCDLPEFQQNQWVEVKLTYPDIGQVDTFSSWVRSLLPRAERDILFEALKRFCTENELEQLLIAPHDIPAKGLNEGDAFAFHISWLLGLFGLPAVVLGRKYEHIRARTTNVQQASVDILATDRGGRVLFLIACTLGVPKDADFGNLLNAREILLREVFEGTTADVKTAVFTGGRGGASYKEVGNTIIPIVDPDVIQRLLAQLRRGRENAFLDFLRDPQFHPIQGPNG